METKDGKCQKRMEAKDGKIRKPNRKANEGGNEIGLKPNYNITK